MDQNFSPTIFIRNFFRIERNIGILPNGSMIRIRVKVAESRSMLISLQSVLVKQEKIGALSVMSIGCQPFQAIRTLRRDRRGSLPFLRFFPSGDHKENHR